MTGAFLDRLTLDAARVEAMAGARRGRARAQRSCRRRDAILDAAERHENRTRVKVPLGVIGIIYESRPNVTADAGALCLKSGNAAILRGGSDSLRTSRAIHAALGQGLREAACRKPRSNCPHPRPRRCRR